jgi:DNA-binding phage protein
MAISADVEAGLAAKFGLLLPPLDERARRTVLAVEARLLGRGGVAAVARAAGCSRKRVRSGLAELDDPPPPGRIRREGAGRKPAQVKDPGLVEALLALVEPARRGDPTSALSWTTLSTARLARELAAQGHPASPRTVAKLLKANGFRLQANRKTLEGSGHPDRDAQFAHINAQAEQFAAAGQPVISVDAKKKELVGAYKNPGREWRPAKTPEPVKVHDFIDPELGKANPYGVYDIAANTGWVAVGTDYDTSAFAVNTIRTWWQNAGRDAYPDAARLLITADGGGSNGHRPRAWKAGLAALAAETGLAITVAHLPPGTSKWNKIEHRLFAHISMNWRGRPLTSLDVVVNTITATTTLTGLRVAAHVDPAEYPLGVKIPDSQMDAMAADGILERHTWHADWNYTLNPAPRPAGPPTQQAP